MTTLGEAGVFLVSGSRGTGLKVCSTKCVVIWGVII